MAGRNKDPEVFLAGALAMVLSESDAEAANALSLLRRKAREDAVTGGMLKDAFVVAVGAIPAQAAIPAARQQAEIARRDARISTLRETNTVLEARVAELEARIGAMERTRPIVQELGIETFYRPLPRGGAYRPYLHVKEGVDFRA